ncbi:MAG: glutamate--tRNA ligase [Candidatus Micrarchaeota archaeon]|nr:MAG: glutamate--tRNA ligase [Candidatus Micrarchaeota archaeon]
MQNLEEEIFKQAVRNAYEHNGKADPNAVLGKVLKAFPDYKSRIQELRAAINDVVSRVNSMSPEDLKESYNRYADEFNRHYQEIQEKTSKPNLNIEGAEYGKVVTRFAPSPNGFMHIGHAKVAFLSNEVKSIYNGKIYLYFDDTNPEKDKQEFVDQFLRDLDWLGLKFDDIYFASDNIERIYELAKQLISVGKAYVCLCTPDTIKRNRKEGLECEHREQSVEENQRLFQMMLDKRFKEHEAVLRFKGDMKDPNTVMRDPTLARIKYVNHYRHKDRYAVWPTYDLNTPVNDSIHGITDVIRSKEYELRDRLDTEILKALGLNVPRIHSESRLVIKNNITHKRLLNKLLHEKLIKGLDDPRLVTIAGLRNRGVRPEAIKDFVLRFGFSKTDSVVDIGMLLSYNKRYIDDTAKRLIGFENPIKLKLNFDINNPIRADLHPSRDIGYRELYIKDSAIYINKDEFSGPGVYKLRFIGNIKIKEENGALSADITNSKADRVLHWLPSLDRAIKVAYVKDPLKDGVFDNQSIEVKRLYVEPYEEKIEINEYIQLEGQGFFYRNSYYEDERYIFISK